MHTLTSRRYRWKLLALAVALLLGSTPAAATTKSDAPGKSPFSAETVPAHLKGVGIDEHLEAALPLDLPFTDEAGKAVRLGDYFDGKRPVIITLNYSNCPMLCSLELDGLVKGLKQVDLELGKGYRAVTVSLDPKETPKVASKTKRRYLKQYGRSNVEQGWHFLTGKEENIRALAKAIGFKYRYDADKDQYYHTAAIAIGTPVGKIARYLYGIEFDPSTLKLSLLEASEGKVGTTVDKLILFCCAYNPKEGSYAMVASRVMSLGGLVTLILLGGFLAILWFREKKTRHEPRP